VARATAYSGPTGRCPARLRMSCSLELRPCSSTTSGAVGSLAPYVATTGGPKTAALIGPRRERARRRCGPRASGGPRRAGRAVRPVRRPRTHPSWPGRASTSPRTRCRRVLAVDALRGAMAGLAGEGVQVPQGEPGLLERLDGVDLPGQVVEPEAAARSGRLRADAEQVEVVVVPDLGRRRKAALARGSWADLHVKGLLVEADAALQAGHVENGVVETYRVDGHRRPRPHWRRGAGEP
jgi:hypothetical protein